MSKSSSGRQCLPPSDRVLSNDLIPERFLSNVSHKIKARPSGLSQKSIAPGRKTPPHPILVPQTIPQINWAQLYRIGEASHFLCFAVKKIAGNGIINNLLISVTKAVAHPVKLRRSGRVKGAARERSQRFAMSIKTAKTALVEKFPLQWNQARLRPLPPLPALIVESQTQIPRSIWTWKDRRQHEGYI